MGVESCIAFLDFLRAVFRKRSSQFSLGLCTARLESIGPLPAAGTGGLASKSALLSVLLR